MRTATQSLAELLEHWRRRSAGQWALHGVGLACLALALGLLAHWCPGPVALAALVGCAVLGVLATAVPDTPLGLVVLVVVALWWLAGPGSSWQALLLALPLWAWHWCAAASASTPSHGRMGRAVLRSTALSGVVVAVLGAAVGGLVVLLGGSGLVPRGRWWLAVLAAVAVVGATVTWPHKR